MTTPRRTRGLREAGCFERATKAERRVSQWDVGPAGSDCWQRDKYGEVFLRRTRIRYDFFLSSDYTFQILCFWFEILGRVLHSYLAHRIVSLITRSFKLLCNFSYAIMLNA
jgi:hypothetical protein